jgi:carbon monoxide dehydrogenase subunit G
MSGRFSGTAVVDRPIDEVFAFLAAGTNDPKFSPRVQEIRQSTDGPVGAGTVFVSTVKDAGMTTQREFELTEVTAPTTVRWTERTKNQVTVPVGGYDLVAEGDRTRVTIFNELEGHGIGKLFAPLALRAARKDADAFAQRIKRAIEAEPRAGATA